MNSITLASSSTIRAKLLRDAGVALDVEPASIDETAIISSLHAEGAKPIEIANTLAEYKAARISLKNNDRLIIGCDQVLVCEERLYEKPQTMDEACENLKSLRNKAHQLLSAVVVYENGNPVWRHTGRAQLIMRNFSDEFIANYLKASGKTVLDSVGCYKIESMGAQLFSRIQGDYFTILGIPLLEVLGFLRMRGILAE